MSGGTLAQVVTRKGGVGSGPGAITGRLGITDRIRGIARSGNTWMASRYAAAQFVKVISHVLRIAKRQATFTSRF